MATETSTVLRCTASYLNCWLSNWCHCADTSPSMDY